MSSLEEEEDWNLGVSMVEDGFIEDLIDGEERCWQMDLIEDLFSAEEVRIISSIPLSLRPSEDRLVWHFNRKGVYNVKSGYHAMRTWRGVGVQASTSSMVVEGAVSKYWGIAWKAGVPPNFQRLFGFVFGDKDTNVLQYIEFF